jgi:hypothetical protein
MRLARPARIRFAGQRLPYHQNARTRRARGNCGKCRTNSSLREHCRCSIGAKSRNQRKNLQSRKVKNARQVRYSVRGGEGGIRTPDTVTRMPHFECGAFNHSATSPSHISRAFPLWCRPSLLPLCYHFSKAMAYRLSRREVNAGGCISLHSWQNVTIEVEGYSHF